MLKQNNLPVWWQHCVITVKMSPTGDSLLLTPTWCMVVHRWSSQRGGEGKEGGGEAPGGWDCAGVPAGLSWGGVRWQPPVPRPRSLPAEVWQLLFTLALQECLLQSLLHQISLNTDTGGAKECVCWCTYVCVRRWRFSWWQPVCVCACACEGESDTRSILDKTTRGWQRDTSGARLWRLD